MLQTPQVTTIPKYQTPFSMRKKQRQENKLILQEPTVIYIIINIQIDYKAFCLLGPMMPACQDLEARHPPTRRKRKLEKGIS